MCLFFVPSSSFNSRSRSAAHRANRRVHDCNKGNMPSQRSQGSSCQPLLRVAIVARHAPAQCNLRDLPRLPTYPWETLMLLWPAGRRRSTPMYTAAEVRGRWDPQRKNTTQNPAGTITPRLECALAFVWENLGNVWCQVQQIIIVGHWRRFFFFFHDGNNRFENMAFMHMPRERPC